MRWQFKVTIVLAFSFALFGLAVGQQPLQLGNIRTLFGKDGKSDPLGLLKTKEVRLELKLTDEQLQKVEDALWKLLAETLDPDQVKRLMQIDLQQRDFKVFVDTKVQADLKFTDEQMKDIKMIVGAADSEIETLMKALEEGAANSSFGSAQNIIDKVNVIRKSAKENCTEVLTAEQRRVWIEMLGDDFRFGGVKLSLDDINPPNKAKKAGAVPPAKKAAKKGGG